MEKGIFLELTFNVILTALILMIFVVVPTTYIIEGYLNIAIYVAPYLYEELTTIFFIKNKIPCFVIMKIGVFFIIILYCIFCVICFAYPEKHDYIYTKPLYIFIFSSCWSLFSLASRHSSKAKLIQSDV